MRLISLKLLLAVSTLSLMGGLIQSDNKQDNPPKKNSVAIVVEESRQVYNQDVSDLVEKAVQEKEEIQANLKQIAEESQEKRQQTENLHKEKEKQAAAEAANQLEVALIAEGSTMNQSPSPPKQSQSSQEEAALHAATQAVPTTPSYQAMSIYIGGIHIPYRNGGQESGQAIIDSHPHGTASTWGGAPIQSGSDGFSTHFIGHNPGIFSSIFQLGIGSTVIVTDSDGTAHTYMVNQLYQVDDYAVELGTGRELWDLIIGSGNGEQVVFQACINDYENLIVIAVK